MRTGQFLSLTLCLAALSVGVGCKSVKERPVSGRVGDGVTTKYERRDQRVLPVTLNEFADQAAQQIAQDISEIKLFTDMPERVTIVFGDIANKTQIVSSADFEKVRSDIRSTLINSNLVRREARFIESRARMNALIARESGQPGAEVPAIDLATAWVLNMDVYRVGRHRANEYYMEVQLVHFQTGEILFSNKYESKQVQEGRNPL